MGEADRGQEALNAIRTLAKGMISGSEDPLRAANAIYWAAWNAGAWQSDDESMETLANVGAEFLQIADELERYQDNPRAKSEWEALIREAATAFLAGNPLPEWYGVQDKLPKRAQSQS